MCDGRALRKAIEGVSGESALELILEHRAANGDAPDLHSIRTDKRKRIRDEMSSRSM